MQRDVRQRLRARLQSLHVLLIRVTAAHHVELPSGSGDGELEQDLEPLHRRESADPENARPRILWVGRLAPVKRLEILLDLAAARPAWEFNVIGSGDPNQEYVQRLQSRAKSLSNVSLHRGATDEQLHEEYLRAHVLVCTSSVEGLPTTFL